MKKLKTFIKIALSLALLLFVFSQIDTKKLLQIIQRSDSLWLVAAFVLFNLSKIISSVRLNYYFKDISVNLSQLEALRLYYVGMFYNLFLPGGIGGDGYKIYLLQTHHKCGYKNLVAATLLDRLSGLVALLFLAALLWLGSSFAKFSELLNLLAIATALLAYPVFLILHKKLFAKFMTYIVATTLLGLLVQLLQVASAYTILKALHVESEMVDYLTLFLISSIVAVLPLTIGGVGAREFTFLYGLKIIGKEPSTGIAMSFLFFLITLISSAIGILFIHKPLRKAP
ncbi:glycosyltransferase 2 family protein [Nitratiruptor sp. YY08-26]|uniref:lysylphosphatidylglycerol synthase transmembrane domain-containing protein n=1 Tax=unclassified Nitratiruptor TaxID=2624044 RepID=UPI00191670A0|nr:MULTISPECIES: lysylphosphatidylglycerol synthase transmembrane domain-containing protein [unclassified Nitratiruptor]BCD62007.1 glycosyltransferase 2 family protein [Nitratiruptor sp. YY08-13]BCD65943.1 glycosyltransferase 2 family protein [Nitratiruptor sp. YY08-26]